MPSPPSSSPLLSSRTVAFLGALLILVIGALIAIHLVTRTPAATAKSSGEAMAKVAKASGEAVDQFLKHLDANQDLNSILGPILTESRGKRLQFLQRNQVVLFRFVRWRGVNGDTGSLIQGYQLEKDKKQVEVFLSQRCVLEAKCVYEFTYYVDLDNLETWEKRWDREKRILTLVAPRPQANRPAPLEKVTMLTMEESLTLSTAYTRKQFEELIPAEAMKLAQRQETFVEPEAKLALQDSFRELFKQLLPPETVALPIEIKIEFQPVASLKKWR